MLTPRLIDKREPWSHLSQNTTTIGLDKKRPTPVILTAELWTFPMTTLGGLTHFEQKKLMFEINVGWT